jgi:hypothetical protein
MQRRNENHDRHALARTIGRKLLVLGVGLSSIAVTLAPGRYLDEAPSPTARQSESMPGMDRYDRSFDAGPVEMPAMPRVTATMAPGALSAPEPRAMLAPDALVTRPPSLSVDYTFDVPVGGWRLDPPTLSWLNGKYTLSAQDGTHFVAVSAPISTKLEDSEVSGEFQKLGGPTGGGYGLIVRDQEPRERDGSNQTGHYYVFEVSDKGEVGAWRRAGGRWVDIIPWTSAPSVREGVMPNALTVRALRDRLTFSVNGADVAMTSDGVLGAGGVGVFVSGDLNDVVLQHFSVRSLPSE